MIQRTDPRSTPSRALDSVTAESTNPRVVLEIRRYLDEMLAVFARRSEPAPAPLYDTADAVSSAAFEVLTRREFSYLSKSRANAYRASICGALERNIAVRAPLKFYLDIGGGYHASTDAQHLSLIFQPGLGEFLVLRQIKRFDDEIRAFYGLGTHFTLVIDNLTALLVNDVPIEKTLGYCQSLRTLIRNLGLDAVVDVLVESEHFSTDDYPHDQATDLAAPIPSQDDIENVSRFLGRPCSRQEARERMVRYKLVTMASESNLSTVIDGVHMTQRATASTFGFRSFPGGDSRIQAGEVILVRGKRGNVRPILLTSRTELNDDIKPFTAPDILPVPLTYIRHAVAAPSRGTPPCGPVHRIALDRTLNACEPTA